MPKKHLEFKLYTRKEVIELLYKKDLEGASRNIEDFKNWIKQNLK